MPREPANPNQPRTPFGLWVREQPTGVLVECQRRTRLSWQTVQQAQFRKVHETTAKKLKRFVKTALTLEQLKSGPADESPSMAPIDDEQTSRARKAACQ